MSSMLIAHVITRLLRAGSEENTIATCLAQAEAGHKVVLIHGNEWNPLQKASCGAGIELIEIKELVHPLSPHKDLAAIRALRALFNDIRPTVVHTHQSKAGIIGRVAARMAKVPLVVHGVHIVPFVDVGLLQKAVYLTAERAVAGMTHAFINVSEGTRQSCLDHSVGKPAQHFIARSGMRLARFRHSPWPDDWRELVGVTSAQDKPPIVLMLAALEPRKRHVQFLEVFDRVVQRVPNVRLLLAGEGTMRAAVEATVARRQLAEHVRVLGHYPHPERLISLCDATVLTSMREGLPRAVIQSLAGGKPVVTARLPGITEIITHGRNGLITDSEQLGATADALSDCLTDEHLLQRLRAGATETDVSAWEVESMCAAISTAYTQAMLARGVSA